MSQLPLELGHRSRAELLLAASPVRTQFVFEVENPLGLHSSLESDRRLQRHRQRGRRSDLGSGRCA